MTRTRARLGVILVLTVLAFVVAACGASAPAPKKVDAATAVGMLGARTVIDVRTPAEYDAGHIAGAQNIDVEAADFGSKIAALDKKAPYLVYCRSGRRSGIAAADMAKAGFTDVVDGGAMADLVAAGAPTQ
jgi:rhodanese-related sulfurtransferase